MRKIAISLAMALVPAISGAYVYQGYMFYVSPFVYSSRVEKVGGTVTGAYGIWTFNLKSVELDVHRVDMEGTASRYTGTIAYTHGLSAGSYLRGGFNYSTNGNFIAFAGLKSYKAKSWNSSITGYFYRVNGEYLKALYMNYGTYSGSFYMGLQVNLIYSQILYPSFWVTLSYNTPKTITSVFFKMGIERYPVRNEGFFLLDMKQDEERGLGLGAYFKYAFNRHFAVYLTGMLETYAEYVPMVQFRRPNSAGTSAFISLAVGYSP